MQFKTYHQFSKAYFYSYLCPKVSIFCPDLLLEVDYAFDVIAFS